MTLSPRVILAAGVVLTASGIGYRHAGASYQMSAADEAARAAKIVGPEQADQSCINCHAPEFEAWQATRHYVTFADRHRSERATAILKAMDQRSMKRGNPNTCRQCHYTSLARDGEIAPTWGVSCESCHGGGRDWVAVHSRPGGNPAADAMKWGAGKSEPAASRQARLAAAAAKGMIHSAMTYEIAKNCYSCHTVPNESLVNKGGHHAGSDFDLVAWSQGEVRHNFMSSAGAPAKPTNRPAAANQRRKLYAVGVLVDLEVSLRNLAAAAEKGGAFHKAMIARVNGARVKAERISRVAPELVAALAPIPATLSATTAVDARAIEGVAAAARAFAAAHDGSRLAAIDAMIPTEVRGKVHRP